MGLTVDPQPTVSPESIPAAGGTVTVSFNAAGDPGATQLMATYILQNNKPYVFSPSGGKTTVRGPVDVPAAGTTIAHVLKLKKSPAGGPAQAFVVIDLEVVEVDASGAPVDVPFPRSVLVDISS
jgi:hypothetical protein